MEISLISPVAVNTELGLGLSEPRQRQFRKIEPASRSPTRSCRRSRCRSSTCTCPSSWSISERMSALMPVGVQDFALARCPMPTTCSRTSMPAPVPATSCARPTPRAGAAAGERAGADPRARYVRSHSAISLPISGPWSSWRKCKAFSITRGGGLPIEAAKRSPTASGRTGSASPTASASGGRSSRRASCTRCPSLAPGQRRA